MIRSVVSRYVDLMDESVVVPDEGIGVICGLWPEAVSMVG